jgi:hypothetical protein
MLKKDGDPYIEAWRFNRSKPEKRAKYDSDKSKVPFNKQRQDEIEMRVSEYIRDKISFIIIPINNRKKRHDYEYGLISAICQASDFLPSDNWLGKFQDEKMSMWVSNGITDEPLTDEEFEEIKQCCKDFK